MIDHLATLLRSRRLRFSDEALLQADVAELLKQETRVFWREYELSRRDRIDFLVESIGIECKVAGSMSRVAAQLLHYAEHETISGLILVTRRSSHVFPDTLGGKPVRVVWIGGSGL